MRYSDPFDVDDIIASNRQVYSDPRFDDIRYQLVDFRDVHEFEIPEPDDVLDQLRIVAGLDRAAAKSNPHICIAVLTQDEAFEALAAFYESEMMDSPWAIRVFSDTNTAHHWIERKRQAVAL